MLLAMVVIQVHVLTEIGAKTENASLHRKVEIKFSNSTGINDHIAVDIDGALKSMKFTSGINIENEIKSEKQKFFEYEIDF